MLHTMLLGSLASTLAPALPSGEVYGSAIVYTDIARAVEDATVLFHDEGGDSFTLTTNPDGQTGWIDLTPDSTPVITLSETQTPEGIALGMVVARPAPSAEDPLANNEVLYYLFQPLAQPIVANPTSTEDVNINPMLHGRWQLVLPRNAQYAFFGNAAPLLSGEEAQGFFDYNSVPHDLYGVRTGLTLRTPAVQFGTAGIWVAIDTTDTGITSTPQVDLVHFQYTGGVVYLPHPAQAEVVSWDPVEELAWVHVTGDVPPGDLSILLTEQSATGQLERYMADPVAAHIDPREDHERVALATIAPSPRTGAAEQPLPEGVEGVMLGFLASPSTAAFSASLAVPATPRPINPQNCTPEPPGAPQDPPDCVGDAPKTSCDCTNNGTECEIKNEMGTTKCGGAGDGEKLGRTTVIKGSVSIGFKYKAIELKVGSDISFTEHPADVTFDAGANGCGQCKAKNSQVNLCTTSYTCDGPKTVLVWVKIPEGGYVKEPRYRPCADPNAVSRSTSCSVLVAESIEVCDRECN